MGAHLIDGQFQSDKYPTCPRGKVPLSVNDVSAQDLLWEYAQRRRAIDAEFADDLEFALVTAGFPRRETVCFRCQPSVAGVVTTPLLRIPTCSKCGKACSDGHWVHWVQNVTCNQ